MFALGNEIPPGVVRWHGRVRVERFLRDLYDDAKAASPGQPVHLRQLSADRVPRSLVLRRLRVQRLPAPRGRAARVPRAAAAHRRPQAAAARRGGRRQHPRGRRRARPTSPRCTSARRSRKARAARSRSRGPTSGGAAAIRSTTGRSASSTASAARSRRRSPSPRRSPTRRFRPSARRTWPRVSVVVCAYNAADTLEDCLPSLERLTYPDYEIILVNDGSTRSHERDRAAATRACASSTSPNGGLSAARNVGLAEATGEIVAYTDADTRVDRDWLTYPRPAVPHLGRRRLGRTERRARRRSADGAVHRARAGRPDARAARRSHRRARARLQHGVPPRRAARDRRLQSDLPARRRRRGRVLAAAGAGLEDRLRVGGARLAPPPLVDRRRTGGSRSATARARRWLMAHHPEKFLDGRMLWRGRIYSPLPFVRSLWGTRINAGVWGTAAFPSVYRTDVHPFAFLPHSIRWQVLSFVLTLAGVVVAVDRRPRVGGGAAARHRRRRHRSRRSRRTSPTRCGRRSTRCRAAGSGTARRSRISISFSRSRGCAGGFAACCRRRRSRCRVAERADEPWSAAVARAKRGARCCSSPAASPRIASGARRGRRPIACSRSSPTGCAGRAPSGPSRSTRAGRDDRDVSVLVGRWAWLDVRALVEEHGGGKALLRVSTHLRPTIFGVVTRARRSARALLVGGRDRRRAPLAARPAPSPAA